MKESVYNRFKDYDKGHCWQYEVRLKNLSSDLITAGIDENDAAKLRVGDFVFSYVDKQDSGACEEIKLL